MCPQLLAESKHHLESSHLQRFVSDLTEEMHRVPGARPQKFSQQTCVLDLAKGASGKRQWVGRVQSSDVCHRGPHTAFSASSVLSELRPSSASVKEGG